MHYAFPLQPSRICHFGRMFAVEKARCPIAIVHNGDALPISPIHHMPAPSKALWRHGQTSRTSIWRAAMEKQSKTSQNHPGCWTLADSYPRDQRKQYKTRGGQEGTPILKDIEMGLISPLNNHN